MGSNNECKKSTPMVDRKRIYLHIGTHRTGSTSLQSFLVKNRQSLHRLGYGLYRGHIEPQNHIELYLAAMRSERDSAAKLKYSMNADERFIASVQSRVNGFLEQTPCDSVIFTSEGLSLLRFDDELERLSKILDLPHHDVVVVLVLRNREDFLNSYKKQMMKSPGRRFSQDKTSAFYVETDSWLADFETLMTLYKGAFGKNNHRVVDYDQELARNGNALPAVLEAFDLSLEQLPNLESYWLNASRDLEGSQAILRRAKNWLARKIHFTKGTPLQYPKDEGQPLD